MGRLLTGIVLAIMALAGASGAQTYSGLVKSIPLRFAAPDSEAYLGGGWWALEPGGARWTGAEGKDPEIRIPVEPGRDYLIRLNLLNIPIAEHPGREMKIESYLDGEPLRTDRFTVTHGALMFELPDEKLRGKSQATIRFHTPFFMPSKRGGGDDRTLGVKSDGGGIISFARNSASLTIRQGKARIAILNEPKLPVHGTPSSAAYLEKLLSGAGYGVTRVSAVQLANPLILDQTNFDLLILPQGESFPAEARFALARYLRQGGDLIAMGGYAFDHLFYLDSKGTWRAREELFGKLISPMDARPVTVLDFSGVPKGWEQASNKPNSPDILQDKGYSGGKALEVHTDNLTGWDVAMSPKIGSPLNGGNITTFWAKGDEKTPELSIEWREKDSSRWIAVIELSPEWKKYMLRPEDFKHWQDGTDRNDILRMENAERIGFGLAQTHTRRVGSGPHSFWVDELQVIKGTITDPGDDRINTRVPEPYSPDQVGVFDASFKLKWVDHAQADSRQFFVDPKLKLKGRFTGYAAIGRLDRDSCRWIPLINGLDRYGRLRGSIGSLAINYSGERQGSVWAYFGVDNADLFSAKHPEMSRTLVKLVDEMVRGVYLSGTGAEMDSYRFGEEAIVRATASNFGKSPQRLSLRLQILAEDGSEIRGKQEELTLLPGEAKQISLGWKFPMSAPDFCRVRSTLLLAGKQIDTEEAAFTLWNEKILRSGPRLTLKNGRFELNGAPRVLFGSNEAASFWSGLKENNPLGWDRELSRMADDGLRVIRLHTAPQFFWPQKNDRNEAQFRKLDAWVQLCRKHGIAPYIDLMDWAQGLQDPFLRGGDYYMDPAALAGQRDYQQYFVSRYKEAAGILYDADNEPGDDSAINPTRTKLWNDWLTIKYGTTENLAQAWGSDWKGEKLGQIPNTPGDDSWRSRRTYDNRTFQRTGIRDGWVRNFASSVHQANAGAIASISGLNIGAQDFVFISDPLDFVDNHFYHALDTFPTFLKSYDLRAMGLPAVVGEFGSTSHPTRTADSFFRPAQEQIMQFLLVSHYLVGCGGAMALSWDHRDNLDSVFPWGLNYAGDLVSKDVMLGFRQAVRFFNRMPIEGSLPDLAVCVPDNHRLGGRGDEVSNAVTRCLRNLVECKVDYTLIHENALSKLPASVKALVFPIPYCLSDETYAQLKAFVERGGALYISGDISYSPEHGYIGDSRLEELAGVREKRPPSLENPWAPREVIAAKAQALNSGVMLNRLGRGLVFYSINPVELWDATEERDIARRKLYQSFLQKAGIQPNPASPEDPQIHCFRQPLSGGGMLFVLMNQDTQKARTMTLDTIAGKLTLPLASMKPGVVALDGQGNITSLEAQGSVLLDGKPLVNAQGHFLLSSLDGHDLRDSKAMMILPIGAGNIAIPYRRGWSAPLVQVGQEKEGRWQRLEEFHPMHLGKAMAFTWDEVQAPGIFIIAERTGMSAAIQRVMNPLGK